MIKNKKLTKNIENPIRKVTGMKIFLATQRGVILPLVFLLILILIPLGLALTSLIKPETRFSVKEEQMTQALQIADAGIERARTEIANDSNYTGPGGVQSLSTGQYTINVSTPSTLFEGSVLPANHYGIESIGYVPNKIYPREKKKVIALIYREGYAPFDFAITAGNGGINLAGSCQINGDVITSGTVTGASGVTGTVTEGASIVATFPPPVIPEGATDLGTIDISGGTNYVINPGTYTCTSITIGGNAQITINTPAGGDPVYLYCSGDIDAGGTGFVNTGQDATTFYIYGTGTTGNINFHGTSDIYAAIYATTYSCTATGTTWAEGSINVYSYTGTGTSDMSYEEGLLGTPGGVVKTTILSWREEKI